MIARLRERNMLSKDATVAEPKARAGIKDLVVDAHTGGSSAEPDSEVDRWRKLGTGPEMKAVINAASIVKFRNELLGGEHQNLDDCTFARARAPQRSTIIHSDQSYLCSETTACSRHNPPPAASTLKCSLSACSKSSKDLVVCALCHRAYHAACALLDKRFTWSPPADLVSSIVRRERDWHCAPCANQPMPVLSQWIPLQDIALGGSQLMVVLGSHKLTGYASPIVDQQHLAPSGWEAVKATAKWHAPFGIRAGDFIIFNIKTIHCANANNTKNFRLSIDARVAGVWPAERPVIPRPLGNARSSFTHNLPVDESIDVRCRALRLSEKRSALAGAGQGLFVD